MPQSELSGPDLAGVVAQASAAGLEHVVIGGFGVIFHGYVRATKDSDLLVPDGPDADAAISSFLDLIGAKRLRDNKVLDERDIAAAERSFYQGPTRPAAPPRPPAALARSSRRLVALPLIAAEDSGCSDFEEEEASVEKKGGGESGSTAKVGDTLTLKGTSYKVTAAETAPSVGDQYTGAKANGIFVVVDLTLTNEESEPATILEDNLRLVGGNGDSFSTSDDALLAFPDQIFFFRRSNPGSARVASSSSTCRPERSRERSSRSRTCSRDRPARSHWG